MIRRITQLNKALGRETKDDLKYNTKQMKTQMQLLRDVFREGKYDDSGV